MTRIVLVFFSMIFIVGKIKQTSFVVVYCVTVFNLKL